MPELHAPGHNFLSLLNKLVSLERHLVGFLSTVNIFGGLYENPDKTSDSSKADEQTGEVSTEPTQLAVYPWALEFEGKFPSGSELSLFSYVEALQARFWIC